MDKQFFLLALLLLVFSCAEEGRIDQTDRADYIPKQVSVTSVRSISGGAVIKYSLPDDINLRGVKAVYDRAGTEVFTQASIYVDSLKIEGLSDTLSHTVHLYSLGKNDALSDPVTIQIQPQLPAIKQLKLNMSETFGGVRLTMDGNYDETSLALTILQDTNIEDMGKAPSQMNWEEVYTYYTSGNKSSFTRNGLDSLSCIYGVYARDRWLNHSDTVYFLLKPMYEEYLPNKQWAEFHLPGDETECLQNKYKLPRMFDGSNSGNNHTAGFVRGQRVKTYTIDMKYTASFSRMRMAPRSTDGMNNRFTVWHWQIWGSMDPNPDGSLDDSWYLLGDFFQKKLSGLAEDGSLGTVTEEDEQFFKYNNDYDFEPTSEILNPQRETRYIRLVLLDSLESYFTVYDDGQEPDQVYYLIGELMFWGQIK